MKRDWWRHFLAAGENPPAQSSSDAVGPHPPTHPALGPGFCRAWLRGNVASNPFFILILSIFILPPPYLPFYKFVFMFLKISKNDVFWTF